MNFLNDSARETFEQFAARGLTAQMVEQEMYRSRDTKVSAVLVRMAYSRNLGLYAKAEKE